MTNPSSFDLAQIEQRLSRNRRAKQPFTSVGEPAEREVGQGGLHSQIQKFCDEQWPRWKVIAARTDCKSTLPVGCHDLTVFASDRRIFLVELKSKTGKLSQDQRDWAHELGRLGWGIVTVRSIEEFWQLVNK